INKHQIRRIDSYVRLSWKTQEDCWRAQQECSSGRIYIGASGRINYLPSNAKQINKQKESHDNQLRARRSACNGQSRDSYYNIDFAGNRLMQKSILGNVYFLISRVILCLLKRQQIII